MIEASRPHYAGHLAPIAALVDLPDDVALVASHRDLVRARKRNPERIILAQHGAGQSYSNNVAAYPGGDDNGDVGLFLVPNEYAAQRWRDAYPSADVAVVGTPILDTLPRKDPAEPVTVAVSFHWEARHTPEAGSALHWFRGVVPDLARRFRLIGHRHPMRRDLPRWYRHNRIEFVDSFAEVCRRADVYICDNSSTLFEFAATDRPVVVLNSPRYRRNVSHGGRFWDWADIGLQCDDPADLGDTVALALTDPPDVAAGREAALSSVYPVRTGAARLAADTIQRWLA